MQQVAQLHRTCLDDDLAKGSGLEGNLRIGTADFQIADRYGILRFSEGGQRAASHTDAVECAAKVEDGELQRTALNVKDVGQIILAFFTGPFAGNLQRAVRINPNPIRGFDQTFSIQIQSDVFAVIDECPCLQTICQQGNGAAICGLVKDLLQRILVVVLIGGLHVQFI